MAEELTLEKLRALASDAGLNLTDEELRRMLPGVTRARQQAAELHRLIGANDEPAVIFAAPKPLQSRK